MSVENYIQQSGLHKSLMELGGCAIPNQRLRFLPRHAQQKTPGAAVKTSALGASPRSTLRESARRWYGTEAVTRIGDTHVPDTVYEALRLHFSDKDIVGLTALVGLINLWNRLAICLRCRHAVDNAKSA
jgi:alkylhydroperoxidase family enzyme